jgi:hypothetical protein
MMMMMMMMMMMITVGRDSSAGIAGCYGLDGPEIESRWERDFPDPSRPVLGPIQHPLQWVPRVFPGGKSGRGVELNIHPHLESRLKKQ